MELENIIHVIGISRGHALEDQSQTKSLLEKEIERNMPHGIGEIGLDYTYGFDKLNEHEKNTFKKKQQELFGRQIQIAKEIDVPIVVHAGYGTDKDIVKILKQEQAQDVGVKFMGICLMRRWFPNYLIEVFTFHLDICIQEKRN